MTHQDFLKALVCPLTGSPLTIAADGKTLTSEDGTIYEVGDTGIVNMLYPKELLPGDAHEQYLYDQAFLRYDKGVSWVFETLNHSDEAATRRFFIDLMDLKPGMKALEVGAGTGKDSALILEKVKPGGTAVLSDLSPNMLKLAQEKLSTEDVNVHYFLGNGSYLPFADDTFDAVFHFGGINTFSERKKAFDELTRVVRPGGKVVVGDESVAPWLRNTPTYATLLKANPLFRAE
ncbi:MAG: class I SAM-dependent methyltransferase, partial [Dyadobacter sp.]